MLKTVAFNYDTREDRILAGINLGHSEAWSCWLTRRLVLALLERGSKFVASTSTLVQRAPADSRGELVAFEHDTAIAKTAKAMKPTPTDVLNRSRGAAELAKQLRISIQGKSFQMELQGDSGDGAVGMLTRDELQRIFQMLEAEVAKADWLGVSAKSPDVSTTEKNAPKPIRH
jgi:hypothetical protein